MVEDTEFDKLFLSQMEDKIFYEEEGKRSLLSIEIGKRVIVRRGRKIPYGKTGIVFFFGPGSFGDRVGFKTDDGQDLWTSASNVDVVLNGLQPNQFPERGWREASLLYQEHLEKTSLKIEKHELVRYKKDPSCTGRVFFVSGLRVGFGDSRWGTEYDLEVFREDVWVSNNTPPYEFKFCDSFIVDQYQVKDYPTPYNEVEFFEINPDGSSGAYNLDGELLFTVTPEDTYRFWLGEEVLKILANRDNLGL